MYQAIVCRIKVRPHPNADRLQLGEAHGYQVIVGLDTEDNELGIFFPCDGQLSEAFATSNDLIGYTDEAGNKKGGYFAKNCRVRAHWRTVETSVNSINYFTDGTISDEYFIVEGYLKENDEKVI